MFPFRKHVAVAIDGGGIRGIIVTRALAMLEEYLGMPVHQIFRLAAGTSTGSVIAAGVAAGLSASQMYRLYTELGEVVFKRSWRTWLWPIARYRYSTEPLVTALRKHLGDLRMGDFWSSDPPTDVVITTFDLQTQHTRFIKPWKQAYRDWPVVQAVLASSAVPTYFPVLEGRYVDGGVGSYANPCYLAAYEACFCLKWDPQETTLISLGTGRNPNSYDPQQSARMWPWQWMEPVLGAFQQSADDQQVHLVDTFFPKLDFRRFQVDLKQPIAMDDITKIPRLSVYGEELGRLILKNLTDRSQEVQAGLAPRKAGI
jgi:patatin-like phospholipase/acyl hydrolase